MISRVLGISTLFFFLNLTLVLVGTLVLHSQACDSGFLIYQPITFQQVNVMLIPVLALFLKRKLHLLSAYI